MDHDNIIICARTSTESEPSNVALNLSVSVLSATWHPDSVGPVAMAGVSVGCMPYTLASAAWASRRPTGRLSRGWIPPGDGEGDGGEGVRVIVVKVVMVVIVVMVVVVMVVIVVVMVMVGT